MRGSCVSLPGHQGSSGFALGTFCLGLMACAFACFLLLAKLNDTSLQAWLRHDPEQAKKIFHESPVFFRWQEAYLRADIELSRNTADRTGGRLANQQMLRWMPADASAWSRFAIDLQRRRDLGPEFEYAVERALTLAPHSLSISMEQSVIAAYNWNYVSTELQTVWQQAFSRALDQPKKLAYLSNAGGVSDALCSILPAPHKLEDWCQRLPAYRKACQRPDLAQGQRSWCAKVGFPVQ